MLYYMVFIILLVLKVMGFVNISWIWVSAPLWIPVAIIAGILLCVGTAYDCVSLIRHLKRYLE